MKSIAKALKNIDTLSFEELNALCDQEFMIVVTGVNYLGPYVEKMVTLKGLYEFIDLPTYKDVDHKEIVIKMAKRALLSGQDVYVRRLRRGLTIKFKSK